MCGVVGVTSQMELAPFGQCSLEGSSVMNRVAEACNQCPAHIRIAAIDHSSSRGRPPKIDSKSREMITGRNPSA